jgi:hypothetical protein
MKKIILILSFSLLAFSSCSSDSNSNEDNSLLFKRWYYVSHTQNGTTFYPLTCTNGQRDYIDIISPNIANFYYIESSNGSNCSGNYAMEPYTFTQNGSVLNMTYSNGNDPSVITISELTDTSLKFVETWDTGSAYRVYSSY